MQRVVVLGPGGSGKSTLARRLSAVTGLPVTHLDLLFWEPGWRPADAGAAVERLRQVVAGERWIVEGNFLDPVPGLEDADGRFRRADTVVVLDLPPLLCAARVLWRLVRDRRRRRPDLPPGCRESLDLDELRWILTYRRRQRPRVAARLAALGPEAAVHRLTTPAAVRAFERGLSHAD